MDRWQWGDRHDRSPLGERRTQILDLLRAAPTPLGVQEIAEGTGLHLNTARFHLDGLVDAGLAERETESRDQPGRPRVVYQAVSTDPDLGTGTGTRSYRLLAEILTGVTAHATPNPSMAASEAGRTWGRYLTERPAPFQRLTRDEAIGRLTGVLTDIGFNPVVGPVGTQPQILLRHCPFREIAEHSREVVCAVHLGLMQGVLTELRAPVTVDRLDPFVEPRLCRANLTDTDPDPADAGPADARPDIGGSNRGLANANGHSDGGGV
ncbi:helix-turn-helix transcriptional regulator [Micromonospora sp. NPDC003197]